jgi:hypothetical protein
MHYTEAGIFKTTDTALASHLIVKGHKLLSIKLDDDGQGLFLFDATPGLDDEVKPFYRGEIYRTFCAYRSLLRKLKSNGGKK